MGHHIVFPIDENGAYDPNGGGEDKTSIGDDENLIKAACKPFSSCSLLF